MKSLGKFVMTACCMMVLASCSSNNGASQKYVNTPSQEIAAEHDIDGYVYVQDGMQISAIVSNMADTLYTTLYNRFEKESTTYHFNQQGKYVKTVNFPTIAISSFFDTDTYEDAGYLGRELAELFVHEMNKRDIEVSEFKLTGKIRLTKEGEYIMSRDYRAIASKAKVANILSGSMTRNDRGIVVVARVIDVKDATVVGSATGFIPYKYLPSCYRTAQKNCKISGQASFNQYNLNVDPQVLKYAAKNPSEYNELLQIAAGGAGLNSQISSVNNSALPGNEAEFRQQVANEGFIDKVFGRCTFSNCDNPVIYDANTTRVNNTLIRNAGNQSQYDRLQNK